MEGQRKTVCEVGYECRILTKSTDR